MQHTTYNYSLRAYTQGGLYYIEELHDVNPNHPETTGSSELWQFATESEQQTELTTLKGVTL